MELLLRKRAPPERSEEILMTSVRSLFTDQRSVAWRLRRLRCPCYLVGHLGPVRSWGADVIVIVILIQIYDIMYLS